MHACPGIPTLQGFQGKASLPRLQLLSVFFFLPSPPYPSGGVKALLSSARLEVEAAYILREEAGRTDRPVPSPHPCLAGCGRAEGTGQGGQGREGLRRQTTRPPLGGGGFLPAFHPGGEPAGEVPPGLP